MSTRACLASPLRAAPTARAKWIIASVCGKRVGRGSMAAASDQRARSIAHRASMAAIANAAVARPEL